MFRNVPTRAVSGACCGVERSGSDHGHGGHATGPQTRRRGAVYHEAAAVFLARAQPRRFGISPQPAVTGMETHVRDPTMAMAVMPPVTNSRAEGCPALPLPFCCPAAAVRQTFTPPLALGKLQHVAPVVLLRVASRAPAASTWQSVATQCL